MALANNDLLIVQKPATKVHYKIKVEDLTAGTVPDGINEGDYLAWTGTDWVPTNTIDGGVYASVKEGIVTSVAIQTVGTGFPNGVITYPTEAITGSGSGLTVEIRYSAGSWTPGYLVVIEGGEGYQAGDTIRVIGGNNDKVITVQDTTQETTETQY